MGEVRYLVERTRDDFEDVGAFGWEVVGGALVFKAADGSPSIAFAAGEWITVCSEGDDQ